jgi:hypothetical protein
MQKSRGQNADSASSTSIDEQWVVERLDRLWPAHTLALADLLIVLRRQFDGDLDALLIMLIVAIGTHAEDWAGILSLSEATVEQRPTNTASIAQISGIPRESVRRKLENLAAGGYVRRNPSGHWLLATGVAARLAPGTSATIRYLARIVNAARQPAQ